MVNKIENIQFEGEKSVTNCVKSVLDQAQMQHDDFSANDEFFDEVVVIKKNHIQKEKMMRVYRGLVKSDDSILEQLPYALRRIAEYGDKPDVEKFEELKKEVSDLANNLSYENFLKYVEKVRPLLHTDEVKYLDEDLKKIEERIHKGQDICDLITLLQVLHAMGSWRGGVSPFVSATTDPYEAARYGNLVTVLDVPAALVSQIAEPSHGEVMLRGFIDKKYITAYLTKYDKPIPTVAKINSGLDKALEVLSQTDHTPVFSDNEVLTIRKEQFKKELSERDEQYKNDLAFILNRRKRGTEK